MVYPRAVLVFLVLWVAEIDWANAQVNGQGQVRPIFSISYNTKRLHISIIISIIFLQTRGYMGLWGKLFEEGRDRLKNEAQEAQTRFAKRMAEATAVKEKLVNTWSNTSASSATIKSSLFDNDPRFSPLVPPSQGPHFNVSALTELLHFDDTALISTLFDHSSATTNSADSGNSILQNLLNYTGGGGLGSLDAKQLAALAVVQGWALNRLAKLHHLRTASDTQTAGIADINSAELGSHFPQISNTLQRLGHFIPGKLPCCFCCLYLDF